MKVIANHPNEKNIIRLDPIGFSLYSTRFDSFCTRPDSIQSTFLKFQFGTIRFDSVESDRVESFDNSTRFRALKHTFYHSVKTSILTQSIVIYIDPRVRHSFL